MGSLLIIVVCGFEDMGVSKKRGVVSNDPFFWIFHANKPSSYWDTSFGNSLRDNLPLSTLGFTHRQ